MPCATACAAGQRCDDTIGECVSCDADGDGEDHIDCGGDDCDDDDAERARGNTEICDGDMRDEDCDPTTFGDTDDDDDGYTSSACCNVGDDRTLCGDDCDDTRADVHPTLPELCNGRDDDCDGMADEDVTVTLYADTDDDGHGDAGAGSSGCPGTPGLVENDDDCDDSDPARHPGAAELCDGMDNDCDTTADDGADATCSLPSAIAGCDAGTCVVVSCVEGAGNCDADHANGCETDITTNMAHCGDCGTACALASATETCTGGACIITACDAGFESCDGLDSSGCERSIRTSSDCGGCGVPCSLPNATPTCASGTCEVDMCAAGYGDCTSGAGCETSLRTTSNCGSCGTACPPSTSWHATGTCSTGTCAVSDCDTGYCDNSPSVAGCETDIDTDPACPSVAPMIQLDVSGDTGTGTSTDSYGPFIGEQWLRAIIRENNVSTASSGCEDLVATFTIDQGLPPVDVLYTANIYCTGCTSTPIYLSHLNSVTVTFEDVCFPTVGDPDQDRTVWIQVEMATSVRTGCGGWTLNVSGDVGGGDTTRTCG